MIALVAPWHCPACRALLGDGLDCASCGRSYAQRDGIADFLGADEVGFYERQNDEHCQPLAVRSSYPLRTRVAMFFADDNFSTNLAFLRRAMARPGTVLDVGCGAGNEFYTRIGPTVGVDVALAGLRRAGALYPQRARARVQALPFPDAAFDYVVSMDFLEHLPLGEKDSALQEMARVLRPGGRMIHVFPVVGRDTLTRWALRFPDLYRRHFVELDGHEGIETPREAFERLRALGLRTTRLTVIKGPIWSKFEVVKRFDNEYRRTALWLDALVRAARLFSGRKLLNHAVNPALWALDRVGTRLFGIEYANRLGICLEKAAA